MRRCKCNCLHAFPEGLERSAGDLRVIDEEEPKEPITLALLTSIAEGLLEKFLTPGTVRDLESFVEFFESPGFRSDGLKLYPTLVIRGTGWLSPRTNWMVAIIWPALGTATGPRGAASAGSVAPRRADTPTEHIGG